MKASNRLKKILEHSQKIQKVLEILEVYIRNITLLFNDRF